MFEWTDTVSTGAFFRAIYSHQYIETGDWEITNVGLTTSAPYIVITTGNILPSNEDEMFAAEVTYSGVDR